MLKFPCKLEQTSATVNTAELFSFFIGFMNYDRKHNALVVFWFLMFLFLIKLQLSIVCTGAIRCITSFSCCSVQIVLDNLIRLNCTLCSFLNQVFFFSSYPFPEHTDS